MATSLRRTSSTASTVNLSGSNSSLSFPEESPRPYRLRRENKCDSKLERALKRRRNEGNNDNNQALDSADTLILSPSPSCQDFTFPLTRSLSRPPTRGKRKKHNNEKSLSLSSSSQEFSFPLPSSSSGTPKRGKKKHSNDAPPKDLQNDIATKSINARCTRRPPDVVRRLTWTNWIKTKLLNLKDVGAYLFEIAVKPNGESERIIVYLGKFVKNYEPPASGVPVRTLLSTANINKYDDVIKMGCEIYIRNTTVLDIPRKEGATFEPEDLYEPKLSNIYNAALKIFEYQWNEDEKASFQDTISTKRKKSGIVIYNS